MNNLMNTKKILSFVYLFFALLGAALPTLSNIQFIKSYGNTFDIALFIRLANANPAAESISRDLVIAATSFILWMIVESRRLQMRNIWIVLLGCITVAFAFAAPFFLFLRERRLIELDSQDYKSI